MVKCNAIKKDGIQCKHTAKHGDKCGYHRDVSIEAVLDKLEHQEQLQEQQQELIIMVERLQDVIKQRIEDQQDLIMSTQQELKTITEEFINKLDAQQELMNRFVNMIDEVKTLFTHIPIINRFFTAHDNTTARGDPTLG